MFPYLALLPSREMFCTPVTQRFWLFSLTSADLVFSVPTSIGLKRLRLLPKKGKYKVYVGRLLHKFLFFFRHVIGVRCSYFLKRFIKYGIL